MNDWSSTHFTATAAGLQGGTQGAQRHCFHETLSHVAESVQLAGAVRTVVLSAGRLMY